MVLLDSIDFEFDFLLERPQQRKFPEPDMEWRAGQTAILLLDHDDINGTRECCRIDGIPCLRDAGAKASNVLHLDRAQTVSCK